MFSTIRNRRSFRWALVAALCASPVMAQQSGLSGRSGAPNNTQNNQGFQQPAGQGNSQLGQGNPQSAQSGTQQQLGTQQGGLRQQPLIQQPANTNQVRPQVSGNQQFANQAQGNPQAGPQGNQLGGNQPTMNQNGANQPGANQPGANQQIPVVQVEQAVNAGLANVVKQPFPDLNAEEQKYIDTVLNIWE